MLPRDEDVSAQIERILHSESFRNAEALRRLLRFLADKTLSGDAEQLKEYTVGIDALGKPPSYDPRQDSVVRIQVGRLRQKLAEYYRAEGASDPILLDLPKGRFKLSWEMREANPPGEQPSAGSTRPTSSPAITRRMVGAFAAVLGLTLLWAAFATIQLWRERRQSAPFRAAWTPELAELWSPFLESKRPVLVTSSAPLFVGLQGAGLYRDLSINKWEDVGKSAKVEAIRKSLKSPPIFPQYNYAGIAIVNSVFHLGKLLAITDMKVSLTRSTQLSWQQLADNNVILIGASRVFAEQLGGLPVDLPIVFEQGGVRNLRPQPGQSAKLLDDYTSITDESAPRQPDDGEMYAVVTHAPGPLGSSEIRSFNSNHSPGTQGAVQAFTTPAGAGTIVSKLRRPGGGLPHYYQLVLKVKYKDTVPTEISYVMHRELQPTRTAPTLPKK